MSSRRGAVRAELLRAAALTAVFGSAAAAPPASPKSAPPSAPAAPSESPRAFLVEVALRAQGLEARDSRGQLGSALAEVRRNLLQAELFLARGEVVRFDQVRAEIAAQLAWIDALLSRDVDEDALHQTRLQLDQAVLGLAEAEERAAAAEARAAAPRSGEP